MQEGLPRVHRVVAVRLRYHVFSLEPPPARAATGVGEPGLPPIAPALSPRNIALT